LDKVLGETKILRAERQQDLREIIKNVQAPLSLMVMGAFSTGKSTFINALLGKEVVSMAVLPTTAVVTKLCYGFEDRVTVFFKNGEAKEFSSDDFARLTATTDDGRDSIHNQIDYVERAMPLDILRQVTIIDSPGLNSMNDEDTDATNRFVNNADTVLWMFSAEQAIGAAEIDAMEKLNSRLKPIAIINKMDTIDDEEDDVEEFLANIKHTLQDKVEAVVGISAKMALLGQVDKNEDLIIESNIRELRTVIEANVLPNRDSYKLYSLLDEFGELLSAIYKDLRVEKEANAKNEATDYALFVEVGSSCLRIEDACVAIAANVKANFSDRDFGKPSVLFFNAVTEINGIGCTQNASSGKATLTTAAMKNHRPAQKLLGLQLFEKGDLEKAFYWLENLTETDDMYAQFALAKCYAEADNANKAALYYRKAAEQGHAEAQYNLGRCHEEGWGTYFYIWEAAKWYSKAAEQGHAEAQYNLGYCYQKGRGVAKNESEAAKWFIKAAEQGHATAQYNLGECYLRGEGVAEDKAEAVKWLSKAAEQG
ncbi:MAG: SEL1-like repeat protein, partial [Peptococcaceae bacterium]|nr:SEL1-like repeat protein [Peptococcaceae bacterium]